MSLRGAVSIARRLQDPLAELVKIEPKSIGVGQYQHDVDQYRLARSLDAVVEDAVNAVGVDLNTASAPLLSRVSGLGASLAEAIVAHRDTNGAFRTRKELLEGARGSARAPSSSAPASCAFRTATSRSMPRRSIRKPMASRARSSRPAAATCAALMGDSTALKALDPGVFVDERFGLPTVRDILAELEKPGRDPRPELQDGDLRRRRRTRSPI